MAHGALKYCWSCVARLIEPLTIAACVAAFAAMILGCSGGSAADTGTPAPAPIPRTDKPLLGYYGSCVSCLAATRDHISFYMVMNWDGDGISEMQRAKAWNIPVILHLPEAYASEGAVRARFATLRALDLLSGIKALYPVDEPDLAGYSAARVGVANAMVRRVMAEFGLTVPLAVIYSAAFTWPGVESYDWVGFDNYDPGAGIFSNGDYQRLKSVLRADQRILLVPGGADPWRQDPTPFFNKAQADPQVIGIVAFLWRDYDYQGRLRQGIGSNGMAGAYRAGALRL